jgi:peptidoglycan/LPS O-acetylase OafA/YrhL
LNQRQHAMRAVGQFTYNLIAGTAAHLILMILGLIATMILFGKMDEGPIHLICAVIIPFFGAGAFIAYRELRWAKSVSILSGCVLLVFPPLIVAAYQDWKWEMIGHKFWFMIIAIPFSLFGCLCVQYNSKSKANPHHGSTANPNDEIAG